MTWIVIAIVAAIAVITLAMVFVPGMATAVFTGLGKALFSVMAANRDERIKRRREYGIFGLKKPKAPVQENLNKSTGLSENAMHTSDSPTPDAPAPLQEEQPLSQRLRDRLDRVERRQARRERRKYS